MFIIVLAGISLSGKSTWKEGFLKYSGFGSICADEIRGELHPNGDQSDQSNNNLIFSKIIPQRMEEYLKSKTSFIVDNTNVDRRSRKLFIDFAKKNNIEIWCNYFIPDIKKSLKYMEGRERKIPLWVLEKQAKNWVTPTIEEGFSQVNDLTGWEDDGE